MIVSFQDKSKGTDLRPSMRQIARQAIQLKP